MEDQPGRLKNVTQYLCRMVQQRAKGEFRSYVDTAWSICEHNLLSLLPN